MLIPKRIWRDVEGYEGLYQVSNTGKVRSLNYRGIKGKKKILKGSTDKDGYHLIVLSKNNKQKTLKVHRLVAKAFIPNPNDLPCINHIDENKKNNCIWNLEWCTYKYNTKYSGNDKKGAEASKKKVLCIETGIRYSSITEASKAMDCHISNIAYCINGKTKTACGYHWEFIE